jgi:hypothetical protein
MSLASGQTTPETKEINIPELTDAEKAEIAEQWKDEHEDILIEWAEKAMCYRWLHHRSHMIYKRKNALYTVPVIIISTLTGTANFALDRLSENAQHFAVMIIGALNISAGIVSTISQFLKIAEINEGHRVASIAWDKFYRNIKLELSKAPKERRHPNEMLKSSKEEYDRLTETSPMIQDDVIRMFKRSFNMNEIKEKLSLPEILDDLEKVTKYDRTKDEIEKKPKIEISQAQIMSKLKEVLGNENNNTLGNLNIKNISKKIKSKFKEELGNIGKTVKKKTDDFIIEMKPQIKGKRAKTSINSHIMNTKLLRQPSFNVGATAERIKELEEQSSSSDNETPLNSASTTPERNSFDENDGDNEIV